MANEERVPFPRALEDFDKDDRVSFSKLDNKWILEDDDGTEWEYSEQLSKWVQSLDEALLEQQQQAYAVPGVNEEEDVAAERKKRKQQATEENASKRHKASGDQSKAERKNSAVYVTNLPAQATVAELHNLFSKCGMIAEEIDSGRPRIKLYTDAAGNVKGDALIVYFRPESVALAIQMLDDTDFRFGQPSVAGTMRVKEADFSYKKHKEAPTTKNTQDKKKIIKKTQKLNNKLADWDDDDPSTLPNMTTKWDKVVILKHMFTPEELEEDPAVILDIKEDIRDECSKLGEVTNVTLYDKEADGVASVRFGTTEAAQACIRVMNGRLFGGQQVIAHIADGSERFKKSNERKHATEEDDGDEDERRLDRFGTWLEEEV